MNRPPFLRRISRALVRDRGDRRWDAFLRSTGLLGMAGIALVLVVPASASLVGLAIYTLWVSGPLSPLFPVGLEPVVMILGRLHSPLLVAAIVTGAGLWVEFLSYHLYRLLMSTAPARGFREGRVVVGLERLFGRAPFFAVWVSSWSPLPFWVVRILAALRGYGMPRYLAAIALGRLPKFWIFAALGLYWRVSAPILVGIVIGSTLLALLLWFFRGVDSPDPGTQ
jgi:hypothetical protein